MAKLSMGQLEAQVMNVLWDAGRWLKPGDVHEIVSAERPLSYSTVVTILVRLWRKGRLDRQRAGRAYGYHAAETRAAYTAQRMQHLLAGAGDQAAALSYFVDDLSPVERAELQRLLGERSPS